MVLILNNSRDIIGELGSRIAKRVTNNLPLSVLGKVKVNGNISFSSYIMNLRNL